MDEEITTLKDLCFQTIKLHFDQSSVADMEELLTLPAGLLKELLTQLNVCQLHKLDPVFERKGVSLLSTWERLYCKVQTRLKQRTFHNSRELKAEVISLMFEQFLARDRLDRDIWTQVNIPSFVTAAVESVKHMTLTSCLNLHPDLTRGKPSPLSRLEKTVESLTLRCANTTLSPMAEKSLFVLLHRFLEHGAVKHLTLASGFLKYVPWLVPKSFEHKYHLNDLFGKPSTKDGPVAKFRRLNNSRDPWPDAINCCKKAWPGLKIQSLELHEGFVRGKWGCEMEELIRFLPSFKNLTALTLRSESPIRFHVLEELKDVFRGARGEGDCRLRLCRLSISVMESPWLLPKFVKACKQLRELDVETGSKAMVYHRVTGKGKALERLSICMDRQKIKPDFLLDTLRMCPRLVSLHVSCMYLSYLRSQKELLNTLAESNVALTHLSLMDLKLSDCTAELVNLINVCKLEEVTIEDCRLLETSTNKSETLHQLAAALTKLPSLRKLCLARNRLSTDVNQLSQLFSGPASASLESIDIRANYILDSNFEPFAEALISRPTPRRLTLDLRENPISEDLPALVRLRPFCHILIGKWRPGLAMADYVANM
ncbi:leucine-rich repeat-containing protein 41 [Corythoichthys intestinalis]|uniref:leucine-rich repeat-containing protein 41 n=1 Tax=Corythoichthys intestinalis TaxID=161448 RepID=UPI0025A686C4|nr:leucine-rich repeat-containing protein 41 [Corythoichthys intestinalis]XP_057697926.1 leucine-rich repeat-containing protein 41 [Corythoichthys intestinalis]XP_057697927.1 leucine-rich repeat-containing protein 41 [Corythoichthys intestinalis]